MKTPEPKSRTESTNSWSSNSNKEAFFSSNLPKPKPFFGPATIQPKLKIGEPDDQYEKQADRVADAVVQMPDVTQSVQRQPLEEEEEMVQTQPMEEEEMLQTQPIEEEEELQMKVQESAKSGNSASDAVSTQLQSNSGSGNQLSHSIQSEMSQKIGADFSSVNIHTDSKAVQMSQSLGARAFTHGNDIYFNSGEYNPSTSEGKHLLAHELTHVVQQGNNSKIQNNQLKSIPNLSNNVQISCYRDKSFKGKPFRVANDENMAVRQDTNLVNRNTFYGSKHFYALPSLIGSSAATLKSQKSALELSDDSSLILTVNPGSPGVPGNTISAPRFKGYPRLDLIMKKVTKSYIRYGSKGSEISEIQRALIDAGCPLPIHGPDGIVGQETIKSIKCFQTKVGLVGEEVDGIIGEQTMGLLDSYYGGGAKPGTPAKILHRISAKNIITGTEGVTMKIEDDCGGAAKTIMMGGEAGFDPSKPQGGKNIKGIYKVLGKDIETPAFTTSKQVRDYIIKKIMGKNDASVALSEYWSKSAIERNLIDKEAGINKYANVQTGESHSIVRGDNIGWNWHWGAVIMRSGGDSVTLENFAGSGTDAWDFQMYGLGSKSFHIEQKNRLQSDKVTPEYGNIPITVRIKKA